MISYKTKSARPLVSSCSLVLFLGTVGLGSTLFALANDASNADVIFDVGCMQDVADLGLNCTTNDAQLATASGVDDASETIMAADSATGTINNLAPVANLTRTATSILVTYSVEVCNTSDVDALTLMALMDDIYGDITLLASTSCTVPQTLRPAGQPGDCYLCTFQAETLILPTNNKDPGTMNDADGSTPVEPKDRS